MKRAAAMILAVLMMIQLLPAKADTYSEWYQVETQKTPVYHTVRFVAGGEEISSVSVADGSKLTELPEAPARDGYRFVGWYAGDLEVTADSTVTEDMTVEAVYAQEDDGLADGVLYANEHLYLTGKLPKGGKIDVQPVSVSIEGEEVLAAYDIRIYANENQQKKGKTWQPSGSKVQVHFYDKAFEGEVNIYHVPNTKAAGPEYIGTVEAADGWVVFEAGSFSTYAITRSIEQEVTIGGSTYRITVT